MTLAKKTYTLLFIAVIIIIAILVIWYFFFREPPVEDPNKKKVPVPPGSPTAEWVPETFPLNVGMFGTKIRELQKKLVLPKYGADGKFGNETKSALTAKGYSAPLSIDDYNSIIAGGITAGGPIGKSARAKSDLTALYLDDSPSSPTFMKYIKQDNQAGIVEAISGEWYLFITAGNTKVKKDEVYLL